MLAWSFDSRGTLFHTVFNSSVENLNRPLTIFLCYIDRLESKLPSGRAADCAMNLGGRRAGLATYETTCQTICGTGRLA